jgi:hypothetical protein
MNRNEMKLYLGAQGLFRSSIHAFAHKTLRKPRNRGVSLTAGIIATAVNQLYMNNKMSSYKLLLLMQIEGKLEQYFGLNVKHPNFKTIHILLLERMDTPNSGLGYVIVKRTQLFWLYYQ